MLRLLQSRVLRILAPLQCAGCIGAVAKRSPNMAPYITITVTVTWSTAARRLKALPAWQFEQTSLIGWISTETKHFGPHSKQFKMEPNA